MHAFNNTKTSTRGLPCFIKLVLDTQAELVSGKKPERFQQTQPIMQFVRLKKTALTFITSYEICPFFKGLDCAFQIEIDMTAN